jgi:hypothetical protein
LVEHADDASGWQRTVDFDGQDFAHAFVKNIQGAEAFAAPECVVHEVHRPDLVGLRRCIEGLFDSCGQTAFGAPGQVQPQAAIDPQHTLMVPLRAALPQPVEALPKALNNLFVPKPRINYRSIPCCTAAPHHRARPRHRNLLLFNQPVDRLPAFDWLQSFFSISSFKA